MRYDYLQMIEDLQGQGFTQAEIGDRIGWSLGQVKQHAALIKKIVTEVLALAKQHQEGRVTKKVTFVTRHPYAHGQTSQHMVRSHSAPPYIK
jgi:hypothetical protein